jgi:hypothetical protein
MRTDEARELVAEKVRAIRLRRTRRRMALGGLLVVPAIGALLYLPGGGASRQITTNADDRSTSTTTESSPSGGGHDRPGPAGPCSPDDVGMELVPSPGAPRLGQPVTVATRTTNKAGRSCEPPSSIALDVLDASGASVFRTSVSSGAVVGAQEPWEPGETLSAGLPAWTPALPGRYTLRVTQQVPADAAPIRYVATLVVEVRSAP